MRLIDADALQEKLTKKKPGPANARYTEGFNDALLRFKSMIHAAPTIEPQTQRTGRWIPQDFNKKNGMVTTTVYYCPTCSECGKTGDYDMRYCPNCGADMREDTDDQSK